MQHLELKRDCQAVQIPVGDIIELEKGTEVTLVQSLGGSYTVQVPVLGGLFRIAGGDADALGMEVPEEAKAEAGGSLEDTVWSALRTCYDPEIPVNIVDLGLIYDLRVIPDEAGGNRVEVKMTLTAPGCGMGAAIAGDAQMKIAGLAEVSNAQVDIVWEPLWGPQMMSEDARRKLGIG
jgi:probable FeS assembly SUF system protein SufT